jgi:hypothetical protein
VIKKTDFFQKQIEKCNGLAQQASDKTDRDFWLGMTRRWEGMLEAGERGTLDVEIKPRFERPIFKKRGRWGTPPGRIEPEYAQIDGRSKDSCQRTVESTRHRSASNGQFR